MTDRKTMKAAGVATVEPILDGRPRLSGPRTMLRGGILLSTAGLALTTLSGCSMVMGSSLTSQVRIIDASPDAPGLDIYENGSVLAYNLGLGTITSYVPISPGVYNFSVNPDGSKTQLVASRAALAASSQYTVLVGNNLASINETILQDQTTPAPAGQVSLRVVDQSTRAGAVDLYLVPSGSMLTGVRPILTAVNFGSNTGYFNVPAGTYTLSAVPTGTVIGSTTTTSYTGSAVVYAGGSARTFVLIDQQVVSTPGLQVITADDFDLATATI